MKIDFAPAWRRHVRAHAQTAVKPVNAKLLRESQSGKARAFSE
jgi:hypothetical protein